MYLKGDRIQKDIKKAICFLDMAVKQNDYKASYLLGMIYLLSEYHVQNKMLAKNYLEFAAKSGHTRAMFNLATMYFDGDGIEKSREKAIYWFKKAEKNGSESAIEMLKTLL